jgi:hypothetical protein
MSIKYQSNGIEVEGEFIFLSTIISECNKIKTEELNLAILRIFWQGSRNSPEIEERIVLPRKNIDRIIEIIIDKDINFGEIHGKHSEIYGTIDSGDISIIEDKEEVQSFLASFQSGHSYDHSFLYQFSSDVEGGVYDDLDEEFLEEFNNLWKLI